MMTGVCQHSSLKNLFEKNVARTPPLRLLWNQGLSTAHNFLVSEFVSVHSYNERAATERTLAQNLAAIAFWPATDG